MKKGNQEQICVKLDQASVASLELEYGVSGIPRNRLINRAVIYYCQIARVAREIKCGHVTDEWACSWFINNIVPELLKRGNEIWR